MPSMSCANSDCAGMVGVVKITLNLGRTTTVLLPFLLELSCAVLRLLLETITISWSSSLGMTGPVGEGDDMSVGLLEDNSMLGYGVRVGAELVLIVGLGVAPKLMPMVGLSVVVCIKAGWRHLVSL